jgi:hypothetical protein
MTGSTPTEELLFRKSRNTKNEKDFDCSSSFESLNKITAEVAVSVMGSVAWSFEVLATVDTTMLVVWNTMLCSLVDTERHFV